MKIRYKNQFRIIAGTWRSRRCPFPDRQGLRPTPDRVRETLFNWLGDRIAGARCLDLFAGSGALGLEALSRGASRVVFVDSDRDAVAAIKANVSRLDAQGAEVALADARDYLAGAPDSFDVIFLDPPFASGLLNAILPALAGRPRENGRVYLEFAVAAGAPPLPPGWSVIKSSRAGHVGFALAASDGSR